MRRRSDKEFVGYQHAFLKKVDQYYRDQKDQGDHKYTKNEEVSEENSH